MIRTTCVTQTPMKIQKIIITQMSPHGFSCSTLFPPQPYLIHHRLAQCFWVVVLEKTLESLVENKEIKPVHPKGNQLWMFIGRTDAEVEVPILWSPDANCQLIGKDPDAGKDWGQEEKGKTEDEIVGWHHWLNGHEFQQTLGDSEGQRNLVCCSPSQTWLSHWTTILGLHGNVTLWHVLL